MTGCGSRPGYRPDDRTARADRRPCDPGAPTAPGQPKKLFDAELMRLTVVELLLGLPVRASLPADMLWTARELLPYRPNHSGYHKRLKAAGAVPAAALDHLVPSARRAQPGVADRCHPNEAATVGIGVKRFLDIRYTCDTKVVVVNDGSPRAGCRSLDDHEPRPDRPGAPVVDKLMEGALNAFDMTFGGRISAGQPVTTAGQPVTTKIKLHRWSTDSSSP
jgi:hypothetical protein